MERKGLPRQLKENCKLWLTGDYANVTNPLSGNSLYNDASLVRYYTMDDLTEKNGNTLTNSGCTSIGGKFGGAYSSNGTGTLSNSTSTGITNGACTVSTWFKVNGTHPGSDHPMIAAISDEGTDVLYGIGFNQTNTQIRFSRLRQQIAWEDATYSYAPTVGEWHHAALTYDGSTVRGYLNGVEVASVGASGNGSGSTPNGVQILHRGGGDFFNGAADEVSIFSRVLSASEIASIYGQGIAFDASGNNSHGTLVNSPTPKRRSGYNGFQFNGTNQYVTVPSNADTVIGTSDFTFSVTAKFDNITSARCLVSKMNEYYAGSTVATGFAFGIADVGFSNWSFGFATWEGNANSGVNGAYNTYYGLQLGVPARVSCIRRGTSLEVWLNGNKVLSNTGAVRNLTNTYPLNLGRYNWAYDQYFQGIMSNPVFELRAFSKEEMELDAINFFIPS